jgi:hypothetical protein
MRLQLSALAASPLNPQQQAPLTHNNNSLVKNTPPALAQRQGLTEVLVQELEHQYTQIRFKLRSVDVTTTFEKFARLRQLETLINKAECFINCLNHPEWATTDCAGKVKILKDFARELGLSRTINVATFKTHITHSNNNDLPNRALRSELNRFKERLKAYLEGAFNNEEIQRYLKHVRTKSRIPSDNDREIHPWRYPNLLILA